MQVRNNYATATFRAICVFAGSRSGRSRLYTEAAAELGRELTSNNIALVYGGGNDGMMGILASTVLANNGYAIGVYPRFLEGRESPHPGLTELHIVDSMHERKKRMADLADA